MSRIFLSLGTNLGDRQQNLQRAIDALQKVVAITAVSPVYETDPWGDTDQPQFLNLCLAAQTETSPLALLPQFQQIETTLGRTPTHRWGPRLIDIDLLFYDALIFENEQVTIPHPRLAERAFVLAPLTDIAPDFAHPQTGETIAQMLMAVFTTTVHRLPAWENEPLFPLSPQ